MLKSYDSMSVNHWVGLCRSVVSVVMGLVLFFVGAAGE